MLLLTVICVLAHADDPPWHPDLPILNEFVIRLYFRNYENRDSIDSSGNAVLLILSIGCQIGLNAGGFEVLIRLAGCATSSSYSFI